MIGNFVWRRMDVIRWCRAQKDGVLDQRGSNGMR